MKRFTDKLRKVPLSTKILSVLLTAALAVILILLLRGPHGSPASTADTRDPIPDTGETVQHDGNIHLPGYEKLTFAAGKKEQTVKLPNPKANTCLIRISLILADGRTLWTSETVEPGYYCKPIVLNFPLEAGTYENVLLKYECFTNDGNMSPLNGAQAALYIVAQ